MALITGASYLGSTNKSQNGDETLSAVFALVASGAFTGAMFGAGIGALLGAERWTTVYSSPVRVSFRPAPSGARGVGVSVRF